MTVFTRRSMCVLSRWPLFTIQRDWLCELYRVCYRRAAAVRSGSPLAPPDAIRPESYVENIAWEIPLPPPGKVRAARYCGGLSARLCALVSLPSPPFR